MIRRSLDKAALTALRKARRKSFGSPAWGDHVLHGVRMFTVAKQFVADTGRKLTESVSK